MYNYVICNGSRPVLGVIVTAISKEQNAIWVKGTQYNKDLAQWIEVPLALRIGPFAAPKLEKIQVNDTILVKVMFDEGSNQVGTAEEIGIKGDTIITFNNNNNKKYVTYSKVNGIKVYNKKDGTGKQSIQFSFKNPLNAKDGTYLGSLFEKTNDEGKTISSYWLNSSLFYESKFESNYTAEKAETEIGQGDTIFCVTAEIPNKNDPTKLNYSCNKYIVLEKAAPAPAVVSNPYPEIPGIQSPVASESQMLNANLNQTPTQATPAAQPTVAPQQTIMPLVTPVAPQQTAMPPVTPAVPQQTTPVTPVAPAPVAPAPMVAQTQPTAPMAPAAPTPVVPTVAQTTAQPSMAAPQIPMGMPMNLANQLPFA